MASFTFKSLRDTTFLSFLILATAGLLIVWTREPGTGKQEISPIMAGAQQTSTKQMMLNKNGQQFN
jgi:hypothetical protein